MQNKIIFITYCPESLQKRFGTLKCINSLKYFHSEIPVILYGNEDINRVYKEYNVNLFNALPCIILDAKRKYNTEYVVHVDSDSLCLGRLNEILEFDYQIASCRNNCDLHTGDERSNRPQCLWELPNEKYVNCGLTATNSEQFLLEWIDLNKKIIERYGKIEAFWQADIQWFNYLFHYKNYKSKILDPKDRNLFYGPSANMYKDGKWEYFETGNDPVHITKEYGKNGWQSWKQIEYKNNEFWLYNKQVKLLHQAGGGNVETVIKLSFDMFNPEIVPILKEITKCNE